METNANDSNLSMTKIKDEPTEFTNLIPKLEPYFSVENYVNASVPMTQIKLEDIGMTQNILNYKIAHNGIKIKLELSDDDDDDDDFLSHVCSTKVPGKTESTSINSRKNIKTLREGSYLSDIFTVKNSILKHISINNKESYKCNICSRHFKTEQIILKHMKLHYEQKGQVDDVCLKSFQREHCKNETNYKCDICANLFALKANLLRHMKIHATERNYKCEVCTKCFTTNEYLSRHLKLHFGEKKYKCEICSKCFARKYNLMQHFKVHTSENNYMCEICSKCFIEKIDVMQHMKVHMNKRDYKFGISYKRIKRSIKPQQMKLHTHKSYYKCEFCSKCFVDKSELSLHLKVHVERNYKDEIFNQQCGTKKLLLKMHPEESLRKCPHNVETIGKVEKRLKGRTDNFNDTKERNPSMATDARNIVSTEDKSKSTERCNLWKLLNTEIIIKEEKNIIDSTY